MTTNDNVIEYKLKNYMRDGENIHIFKMCSRKNNKRHTHDCIELVYILQGDGTEWINDKEFSVKKGDLIFVNRGQTHAFRPGDDGLTYINIMLNLKFVSESLINAENAFEILTLSAFEDIRNDVNTDLSMVSFSLDECRVVEPIFEAMLEEYQSKEPAYMAAVSGYLKVILAKMVRKMRVGIGETEQKDIWNEITEYIADNLNENLTLTALSERCFYNPSYFSRVFKKKFGITLTDYIVGKRLEHAAFLLKSGNASIEYISEKCVFLSKAAFYRAFAKKFDCTPNEYRNSK